MKVPRITATMDLADLSDAQIRALGIAEFERRRNAAKAKAGSMKDAEWRAALSASLRESWRQRKKAEAAMAAVP